MKSAGSRPGSISFGFFDQIVDRPDHVGREHRAELEAVQHDRVVVAAARQHVGLALVDDLEVVEQFPLDLDAGLLLEFRNDLGERLLQRRDLVEHANGRALIWLGSFGVEAGNLRLRGCDRRHQRHGSRQRGGEMPISAYHRSFPLCLSLQRLVLVNSRAEPAPSSRRKEAALRSGTPSRSAGRCHLRFLRPGPPQRP